MSVGISRRGFLLVSGGAVLCGAGGSRGEVIDGVWMEARGLVESGVIGRVVRGQASYVGFGVDGDGARLRALAGLVHGAGVAAVLARHVVGDGSAGFYQARLECAGGVVLVVTSGLGPTVIRGTAGVLGLEDGVWRVRRGQGDFGSV